jgi:hypothetical protein
MFDNLRTVIEAERAQLVADREEYLAQRTRIDNNLVAIGRELDAFAAFEKACDPNTPRPKPAPNGAGTRARYGTRRVAVWDAIRAAQAPMTRGEILHAMGLHGTKGAEMSVSNALSALKKSGRVVHENGRYAAV